MTGFRPELKFVAVDKPGRSTKPGDEYALRSHVRRMIALDKASRPKKPNLRFVPVSATALSNAGRKKQSRCQITTSKRSQRQRHITDEHETPSVNSKQGSVTQDQRLPDPAQMLSAGEFGAPRLSALQLQDHHPFATVAREHVDLPLHRLNSLFKSDAFRHAAEPLFDTTHIESSMSMNSVFPLCLSSHAFLNALVYSIVQASNRGKVTLEQLRLKSRTIAALHETIISRDNSLTAASVSTIMILRGVAYKWEDYATHELHAKGLAKALQSTEDCLTPAARRALFWQDLFASILISAPRKLTHDSLPEQIHWKRCQKVYDDAFPRGFLRHRAVLPDDLLDCIQDLVELQTAAAKCEVQGSARQTLLEPLQAHIESRLAFQTKPCESFGIVASSTRLALFIITYTSHMSTWDFSLIPGRIAEQLIRLLESTLYSDLQGSDRRYCCMWSSRHDLLLWLLLVGATAAAHDGGVIEGLGDRYTRAIGAYREKVVVGCWSEIEQKYQVQTPEELSSTLRSTLEDFVLTAGWAERRLNVPGWFELELAMDAAFLFAESGQSHLMNSQTGTMGHSNIGILPLR